MQAHESEGLPAAPHRQNSVYVRQIICRRRSQLLQRWWGLLFQNDFDLIHNLFRLSLYEGLVLDHASEVLLQTVLTSDFCLDRKSPLEALPSVFPHICLAWKNVCG